MTRLAQSTCRKLRLVLSVRMPIPAINETDSVRKDISDILSGFLSEYTHMEGSLAKIRDGIYSKYFQVTPIGANSLNSMLCKYNGSRNEGEEFVSLP